MIAKAKQQGSCFGPISTTVQCERERERGREHMLVGGCMCVSVVHVGHSAARKSIALVIDYWGKTLYTHRENIHTPCSRVQRYMMIINILVLILCHARAL